MSASDLLLLNRSGQNQGNITGLKTCYKRASLMVPPEDARMRLQQSAWDTLANYEAHDIVRARYKSKHGGDLNATGAREIAAPFTQARHYYDSAALADRTVKPLLLYYGVVSLTRGLVLFLTRKREATLSQSHGLSVMDWQTVLAADNPDFAELKVVTNGSGTFPELANATGNRRLLRSNSSGINLKLDGPVIPSGANLSFGDILASLPELSHQIRHWKHPRCFAFTKQNIPNSKEYLVTILRRVPSIDEGLVISTFGQDNCKIIASDEEKIVIETTTNGRLACEITDLTIGEFAGIGTLYLAPRYTGDISISKICQLFAISYIMSMLVRYYPSTWMNLIYQRISDAASPTILKAIDCIEVLFPQIVVDYLEEI